MQFARSFAVMLTAIVTTAAAQDQKDFDAVLGRYFNDYCDYTGSLGIGFFPGPTYDYEFRQRLKKTTDMELKRLFVLKRLYIEAGQAISQFEMGLISVDRGETRKMTP